MTDALRAVRSLAELGANQRGHSFIGSDLRLFQDMGAVAPAEGDSGGPVSAFSLGRTYEVLLTQTARRRTGSHLTPESIARNLIAMMPSADPEDTVLDPAVGGAAFLLASADQLVEAGASPAQARAQLYGVDIDEGAVVVAEAALALWAIDQGLSPTALPQIAVGDGLLHELPRVDRVVGNPPFLNQLRTGSSHGQTRRADLRTRWGDLVTAYTDDAWLFIAAGIEALLPGGCLAMVQPTSVLSAGHGRAVREHVHEQGRVSGLWLAREQVFDAAVDVCGVVIETKPQAPSPQPRHAVKRRVGASFTAATALRKMLGPDDWGSAASELFGVPQVRFSSGGEQLRELVVATAGFRDQFYGLAPHVAEAAGPPTLDRPKLVTVGMIDVMRLAWGERVFKFAKQPYERPVLDRDSLHADDPKLGEWVAARLRPKLLVATQTKVVECWVDVEGHTVPATPVVSVEPRDLTDVQTLWRVAAALTAPAVSAYWMARKFGSGMSRNSMRISATDIESLPLPKDHNAWDQASELLQNASSNPAVLADFAAAIGEAYGIGDPTLVAWWMGRQPNKNGE